MTDREKVIKAIEICYTVGHNCTECPFLHKDECNDELMHEALAILREQEPVEPLVIHKDIVDEIYDCIAECPACGMTWAMWHPDRMRFCPGCGKAVKWDD